MKRLLSTLLVATLIASSIPASAESPQDDWSRVKDVHTAAPLLVSIEHEAPGAPMSFLHADDDAVVLLDTSSLPPNAARLAHDILREQPNVLTARTGEYVRDGFRLTPTELFDRGAKVADRAAFVRTIARSQVL